VGPDTPLAQPIEPTPYSLVMATGERERPFPSDPTILDVGVPAGPASPSPPPRSVADARTVGGSLDEGRTQDGIAVDDGPTPRRWCADSARGG
jgi:hypothetical protein